MENIALCVGRSRSVFHPYYFLHAKIERTQNDWCIRICPLRMCITVLLLLFILYIRIDVLMVGIKNCGRCALRHVLCILYVRYGFNERKYNKGFRA